MVSEKVSVWCALATVAALTAAYEANAAEPDRRSSEVEPSISVAPAFNSNGVQIAPGRDVENEMTWHFLCHSYRTGIPRDCFIDLFFLGTVQDAVTEGILTSDCQIDAIGRVVSGTCANGGHRHDNFSAVRPRTRIFQPGAANYGLVNNQDPSNQLPITYTNVDELSNQDFQIRGNAAAAAWETITSKTPDNAGSFYYRLTAFPPQCFFLARFCTFTGRGTQDDGSYLGDGTMDVRFRGIAQLPNFPTLYTKVRTPEPDPGPDDFRHVNAVAFGGTSETITAMQLIAQLHLISHNKRLRPNDMSLPFGGLFDVRAAYRYTPGGHRSHREGEDIDLNRSVFNLTSGQLESENCESDYELHLSVHNILAPEPGRTPRNGVLRVGPGGRTLIRETALLCESGGRKHIDVIQILSLPPPP